MFPFLSFLFICVSFLFHFCTFFHFLFLHFSSLIYFLCALPSEFTEHEMGNQGWVRKTNKSLENTPGLIYICTINKISRADASET